MAFKPEDDTEELKKFRETWKAEVGKISTRSQQLDDNAGPCGDLKAESLSASAVAVSSTGIRSEVVDDESSNYSLVAPVVLRPTTSSSRRTQIHNSGNSTETKSKSLQSALASYRLAVLAEQEGDLDRALQLYRHAFKSDSNVDKAYHTEELAAASAAAQPSQSRHNSKTESKADSVQTPVTTVSKLALQSSLSSMTKALADLIIQFPSDLTFEPEDEKSGVLISLLPDELLVHVLRQLDYSSIERFALVNKKARLLSLDVSIWRNLASKTYVPPQISLEDSLSDILSHYDFNYRRLYIEHPRVRLDGVYIAVCHYVRRGLSENAWVNVTHLVTYNRYLRFFPNGQVISLLANEEVEPQNIVPQLKLTLRMKGLFLGWWAIQGNTISIVDLKDSMGLTTRYTFQMSLKIRSRPLGRWNRLDFIGYDSVDCDTGEATALALKNERSFWFSKVRSYAQY